MQGCSRDTTQAGAGDQLEQSCTDSGLGQGEAGEVVKVVILQMLMTQSADIQKQKVCKRGAKASTNASCSNTKGGQGPN